MRMARLTLTLSAALAVLPSPSLAQATSTLPAATEPLVVLSSQEMAALRARMAVGTREDLVGKSGGTETAMFFQREADKKSVAEAHRDSDDYHVMLEGSAVYYLGGTLDAAKETAPGEWRGTGITGGRTVELRPGDMIFVPRGTPHQRSTEGRDATYSVIKVYKEPTPKAAPAK
jgi:mannose-6-phosphate isomerase-like protein (cupin superfamily)